MKAAKTITRIISYIITFILLILLAINIFSIIERNVLKNDSPSVFGYSLSVVISGSMSPTIGVDDAIVTKAADSYEVGDIIMFREGNSFVAHRIVEEYGGEYVTRGDANNANDIQHVSLENIVGKTVMIIPHLGVIIGFLQSPIGMLCMLALIIALIELPKLYNRKNGN